MTLKTSSKTKSQKALLAEDDSLIRELVAHYLKKLGYEVVEAENGAIALEILRDKTKGFFDLVVTDLLMPKANGETVIKQAKARGICEKFIVMSGNPIGPREVQKPSCQGSRYLEKPFTFRDFESKLHALEKELVAH
ncbi:response regulator [Pelagicoccus sp. SDUM812002]|uniref:response regulator n=1 Tax=Pelagicoccus sp. SDUM812002 TaxID=3041266 RepID=UPI00280D3211|nr:response regulator [Pelagicoccus sp. SDUM812002]MDQ8184544.1 response regulator [Pelagicoccus sp. SDUM812002]